MVPINLMFIRKAKIYLHDGPPVLQNSLKKYDQWWSSSFKKNQTNVEEEIPLKADYPLHFMNSIVNEFQKGKECGDVTFATPSSLFETFHIHWNTPIWAQLNWFETFFQEISLVHWQWLEEVRWNEHDNSTKSSVSLKNLKNNINCCLMCTVSSNTPKKNMLRPGRT